MQHGKLNLMRCQKVRKRVRTKILIFILLFSATPFSGSSQDEFNCDNFRTGFFGYYGEHQDFVIYRVADYQIEYNFKTKKYLTVSVEWTGPCAYSIVYVSSNMKDAKRMLGKKVEIVITGVDDKGYQYDGILRNPKIKFSGDIKTNTGGALTEKQKSKIIKKLEKTRV